MGLVYSGTIDRSRQGDLRLLVPKRPVSKRTFRDVRSNSTLDFGLWTLGFRLSAMIARVTLEMALRKEFDYLIPPGLVQQVDVGSRVQVPFGPRKVMGC